MNKSVWTDHVNLPEFGSLDRDIKVDVLVIGGGMCGLLCAHFLAQRGVSYALAEARTIAYGVTCNTTAKITSQHGLIYEKILRQYGYDKAKMYLDINQMAVGEYERLCKNIKCGFKHKDSYVYTTSHRDKIEAEVSAVNKLGFDAEFVEYTDLPFNTEGAIRFKGQAQFNPLWFVAELAKDLNIYENTCVRELTPQGAITDRGRIVADKIIVATHFPFINKHGSYYLKMYQHRSYVCAYENASNLDGMYVDEDKKGMSFRNYNNLLLIGAGGHRTGTKSPAWSGVESFAAEYYPKAQFKYKWATQDCMSLDGIPYIGHYSKNTPDMYVATGFNKWGMTSSMASAMILADAVQGKANDYAEVFSPQRSILKPQLAVNGFESIKNLVTPTTKRCPHLGCALKWNKAEHTWDCPCHGSRFTEDGRLINNPSTGDADI